MLDLPIDAIVHHGRAMNLGHAMPTDDLRVTVRSLFEDLERAGVRYTLVGGVALLSYVAGRNTEDIDLIMAPEDLAKVPWAAKVQDRDFATAAYGGLHVDLLLTSNPLFASVMDERTSTVAFGPMRVRSATREGLLLLKLYALPSLYRQGKLDRAALYETDVLMLHHGEPVDDEALLAELSRHLAKHDVDELRRILEEQRARKRFQ